MKKIKRYEVKKKKKSIKTICKNESKIIKFDDAEIEELKFHQYKSSISIKDIDINKIVASNKFPFGKQDFKYFISCKNTKKLGLYAYSFQKWVYIKNILIKINICISW